VEALYRPAPGAPEEIGLFLRPSKYNINEGAHLGVELRAGLVRYNDVILVVTMLRVKGEPAEYFDMWWNYQNSDVRTHVDRLAGQSTIKVHFIGSKNYQLVIEVENYFKRFFERLPQIMSNGPEWNDIEFDRAVRGFCADAYPKDNLWDLIELKPGVAGADQPESGPREYEGPMPEELKPFYIYDDIHGHCIRIIPSLFEEDAREKDPDLLLYPAPIKTVLRCGIRWSNGYPIAPIPFIPGHGLAVPPDDAEF
jgi:hypothetical protein